MNQMYLLFCMISIFLAAETDSFAQSLEEGLKSSNQQVRCDAYYELFGTGEGSKNFKPEMLYGKTTRQIHELLGDPTSIWTLEYKDTRWLRVWYVFDTCPTEFSNEMKESCKKGGRFGPSLLFRNGKSVSENVFGEETGERRYSVTPEHLRFKKGGTFP